MNSKQQFRDALKNEKQLILNLQREIEVRDQHVQELQQQIQNLKNDIHTLDTENYSLSKALKQTKRWYQIFIKYPIK